MSKNVYEGNESTVITFIEPLELLNISMELENLELQENDELEEFELIVN
jgi:hypothetical protein